MKLLSKEVLEEFGFQLKENKPDGERTVMTKNNFEIIITKEGTCYYTNFGIDYPIRDVAGLKKLYKEVKNTELKV